jgi:predicted enzyme related to lactoylglutathione lyase
MVSVALRRRRSGQIAKTDRKETPMGQPVVHFEVIGKDGERLRQFYGSLFGWSIDANNPMGYGTVKPDDAGIGGGIGGGPEGYAGHVTFYVFVPDVEKALQQAEALGGRRVMGPDKVMEKLEIGQFTDPEGHLVGVVHGDG